MENRELVDKIMEWKERRNAVILAHNYQLGEVQDIADFTGDSLELSRKATKIDAEVIVFCGVHFMAETAYILSPDKIVLLPDTNAGCPMADMITGDELREEKKKHPEATVVCYVNSTAEVKAESDVCCTSSNAVRVVNSLSESKEIIFVPDQYLGHYVAKKTQKNINLYPGYCPTHGRILLNDVLNLREAYPKALLIVHPECRPDVIEFADEVLSTGGMIKYCQESEKREVIVGTEMGIIYRLKKENPGKMFIPVSEQAICPNMKLITLEKILWSLKEMQCLVKVSENIRQRAEEAVNKMLEYV